MKSSKSLSNWQVALLIYLFPFTFKMATLPALMFKYMKNDIVIGILIMVILEFIQLFFILKFLKWGGMKRLKEKIGEKWYRLLILPLLLVFIAKIMLSLQVSTGYISKFLFYNIKNANIAAVLLAVTVYLALKGARSIGRMAELVIFIIPLIFIVGLTFGRVNLNTTHVLPILPDGIKPVLQGVEAHLSWIFTFTPFLFIDYEKTRKKPFILVASILSILSVVACYLAVIISYGPSTLIVDFAFARLASFNTVSSEIGSLDLPAITMWLISAIMIISMNLFASGEIGATFKIKRVIFIPIFGFILSLIDNLALVNLETALKFSKSFIRIIVFVIQLVWPILLWLLIRQKKNKTEDKSYAKDF